MDSRRRALIAGNWKMNGLRAPALALARALAAGVAGGRAARPELVVCPPATVIAAVAEALAGTRIAVGGQDCHVGASGAHTGDLSAEMLADAGASVVIVGHSERRADHGETDQLVAAKAAAAHRAGLAAIVCIGETEAERDRGRTLAVVGGQLAGSLPAGAGPANTVIAYEPVWAIGTGRTPTLAEVAEVHGFLRERLKALQPGWEEMRILYGGSVKPDNARALLAAANVDGALVGGASLKAEDFLAIADSAL
ncbi:MAG: triose-phosphate isomerase [Proteobacteria bacterium]|nr:triose-phosphate isomerase [Pseudomonadota bacterium]